MKVPVYLEQMDILLLANMVYHLSQKHPDKIRLQILHDLLLSKIERPLVYSALGWVDPMKKAIALKQNETI